MTRQPGLAGGISGIGARKKRLERDWTLATDKIEAELGRCRNCGASLGVERAHVVGREHDRKVPLRLTIPEMSDLYLAPVLWTHRPTVHPDRIVPLCGPPTDPQTCHGKAHRGELDWLPLLTLPEQLQAVADAGSITQALAKLSPEHNPRRIG